MTTAVTIAPTPILQFFGNDTRPCVGGTVLTQVGGVNAATYQDSAGTTPLPNPIPLNNRGEVSNASGVSCQLFLPTGVVYTFTLFDASGNQLNQALYVTTSGVSGALAAASGSSLIGFIQALTGATATTLQAKGRAVVNLSEDFGADPTGVIDASSAIEAAANSGANYITYGRGATYKITRQLNFHTSGVTHDMRGATITQATTNVSGFLVGYDGAAFAKTDDTTFIGGKIAGSDNGLTTTVGFGISVYPPTTAPYTSGAGCSRTKVIDTWIDNFCGCVAATGADDLMVDGLRSTNMQYHPAASAGGYGVLAQTCFGVKVTERCRFIGGSNSRHAVYISADPGRAFASTNVCQDVQIGACLIDWSAVAGTTGFETGIFIRGASNVSVLGPEIKGAFGGVTYELENAAGSDITIANLIVSGMRAGAGQVSAVAFSRSSGTNRASNVIVRGVNASIANANGIGVQLGYTDGVISGGHNISGASYTYGQYVFNCSSVVLNPSVMSGGKSTAVEFGGACDTVQVDRQTIVGTGSAFGYLVQPTNLRFTYPRAFQVTSNGSGTVTVANEEYPVAASVVSDANGFTVTFNPEIITSPMNFGALSESSSIANVYHRGSTATTVTFGVLNGSLSPLPAATNAYVVAFQAMH